MTVIFLPTAKADLREIHDYISDDNPDKGDELVNQLEEKCLLLGANPRMGRSRPEIRPDLRGFSVPPYILLYRIVDDTIEIVNIIHGSRDFETLF
jgi:toxin ParE1/3/4